MGFHYVESPALSKKISCFFDKSYLLNISSFAFYEFISELNIFVDLKISFIKNKIQILMWELNSKKKITK